MSDSLYQLLKKIGWSLLLIFLALNFYSWINTYLEDISYQVLPFNIKDKKAVHITDSSFAVLLSGKEITRVDTLHITSRHSYTPSNLRFLFEFSGSEPVPEDATLNLEKYINDHLQQRNNIEITYHDAISNATDAVNVPGVSSINRYRIIILIFNIFFVFLIYFNSFLLLRYSYARENVLMIYFLLFLSLPGNLPQLGFFTALNYFTAVLLGVLFFHFIIHKIGLKFSSLVIYAIASGIIIITWILHFLFGLDTVRYLYLWSIALILGAYILLWKRFHTSGAIELKRLLGAFKGVFLTIISLIILVLVSTIIVILNKGYSGLGIYNLPTLILSFILIISAVGILIGILWFFGSFTWGLLTGTALDVKIRSTIIYTLIGLLFITFFGLIDYSLGELLQSLFGNFIGSEFIAGIPATIGLLVFFNPIRNKVENLVDNKLNSSDLDFLEKTDTFTEKLVGESVIEGFEEYICENLFRRLAIKKVALVSYDSDLKAFKFNEIRGSEVIENSAVEDIHDLLRENRVHKVYISNENQKDIASFSMIIPILYDDEHKWFLALGKKNDGAAYTRNDEKALERLCGRIKLSLKFILAYDEIVNTKYLETIRQKNKRIIACEARIKELEFALKGLTPLS